MKDNTTKKRNNRKTKKKIKKCIDCYEQPIYVPAKLYVIKGCTKKDIDKVFGWNDDGTSIVPDKDFYDALVCFPVRRNGDDGYTVAIILVDEFFEVCNNWSSAEFLTYSCYAQFTAGGRLGLRHVKCDR